MSEITDNTSAVLLFDAVSGQPLGCGAGAAELLEPWRIDGWRQLAWPALERRIAELSRTVPPQSVAVPGALPECASRSYSRPDGDVLLVTSVHSPAMPLVVLLGDATAEKQELRRLRLFNALSERIAAAREVNSALKAVLRAICRHAGWQYAEAWLPRPDGTVVELGAAWHNGSPELAAFERQSKDLTYARDTGIPGRVWHRGEVEHIADLVSAVPAPGSRHAKSIEAGLRCVHAVPLTANGETVAVLLFSSFSMKPRDRLIFDLVTALAPQLSLALSRKRLEAKNAAVQRQLADLLATAGEAIVSIDGDQRIVVFNRCAEEMFGYSAGEILGAPLELLLPAASRPAHRHHVEAFGQGGEPRRTMGGRPEIRGRRKDGSEFPAEASISKLVVDGRSIHTAVVRDLTALRAAQAAVREREAQLRMIIDAMPVGISIARVADGTLLLANDSLARMLGYSREALLGRPVTELYAEPALRDELLKSLQSGTVPRVREMPFRHSDGRQRWAAVVATLITFNGEDAVLAGLYDVTDRRQTLDALRKSKRSLADAQRIAQIGNWDWDIASNGLTWSDEIYRIFGLPPQEFDPTYPAFLERVHPGDRSMVEDAVARALTHDLPYRIDHRVVRPDGSIRTVHEQAELTRDASGKPVRMVGTVQDITERKRAEEALTAAKNDAEKASQAKSQFLANMSHELRTPLNAIIGFADIIANDLTGQIDRDRGREYGRDIGSSGRHLLAIINHILDLSRVEAGRMQLDETPIDIGEVIGNCLRMVRATAAAAGVDLDSRVPPDLPFLMADARLCRQILLNLLSNAIKFTPRCGAVEVVAEYENGAILLRVRDSGIGIAPEDLPRALKPFEQLDNRLARRFQGAGLGLSLTDAFVKLHGGTMVIESAPQAGTRVTVRFPAERTHARPGSRTCKDTDDCLCAARTERPPTAPIDPN